MSGKSARFVLMMFGIMAATSPGHAQQVSSYFSAADLYKGCQSDRLLCSGYIAGVADHDADMADILQGVGIPYPKMFCVPYAPLLSDLVVVFEKFVDAHPNAKPAVASQVVGAALTDAYPCKKH